MNKRMWMNVVVAVALLASARVICAQAPVVNISNRHGNLRAAQEAIVQAWQKINRAQTDNHDELGGHAQRAKDFLVQADQELRQAANVANQEGH